MSLSLRFFLLSVTFKTIKCCNKHANLRHQHGPRVKTIENAWSKTEI